MKQKLNLLMLIILPVIGLTTCYDSSATSFVNDGSLEIEEQNPEPQNSTLSTEPVLAYTFSVESDLVDNRYSKDCYILNVRVYMTDTVRNEKLLVASENTQVGNGCPKKSAKNVGNNCEAGYLPNGDFVFTTELGNSFKYCLKDLLLNNEVVYGKYLQVTRELINSIN